MVCVSCALLPMRAYAEAAAGPGQEQAVSSEEQLRLAKLTDAVLEWEEIDELVTLRAPAWLEISEGYQSSKSEYTGACELYRERMAENYEMIDEEIAEVRETRKLLREFEYGAIVDDKGTTREEAIRRQDEAERALRQTRQLVTKMVGNYVMPIKSMLFQEADALEPQREAIVSGIKDTVISYQELKIQRDLMAAAASLEQARHEALKTSLKLGLVSADDVKASELALEQTKLSMDRTELSLKQLKKSIEQSLGFAEGTITEIGVAPAPDTAFFDTIDKEADLKKAFKASEELKAAEKNFAKYGTRALQDAEINKIKASLSIAYETGYESLKEAKKTYEESVAAKAEAEKQLQIAADKFNRGLISRLALRAGENACSQDRAAVKLAELSYLEAIEQYRQMLIDHTPDD